MQKHIDWNHYLYFLKVAETGNLSSAAVELGVNHSTVFRRINSLEKKLEGLNSGSEAHSETLRRLIALQQQKRSTASQ